MEILATYNTYKKERNVHTFDTYKKEIFIENVNNNTLIINSQELSNLHCLVGFSMVTWWSDDCKTILKQEW